MEWDEKEYLAFASDDKELLIRFEKSQPEKSDSIYIEFGAEYLEIPKERIDDLIDGLQKAAQKLPADLPKEIKDWDEPDDDFYFG